MPNSPQQLPPSKGREGAKPQERAGRSGEGSRSVLPHMKADQRARAVARVAKRNDRDF